MFSPCFCCLLLASSDSAHMVCLMRWYHTVVLTDQIGRETVVIRELDLVLWIIKLALQWRYSGSSGMENQRERTSGQSSKCLYVPFSHLFQDRKLNIVQILNRHNWYRTQEWLIQIINQHCFVSLLLSTSNRNLFLLLVPKQCGLLHWAWLCRSTREKELSLKKSSWCQGWEKWYSS